ncbi:MAG: hypothetical protein LCH38_10950 [Proteobacteria bacterium]|nr:hypothetical protein [Pseudomonadota bacterium]
MRVLKWMVVTPVAFLVFLALFGHYLPPPPSKITATGASGGDSLLATAAAKRTEILQQIAIDKLRWTKNEFGRVTITAEIVNRSSFPIKDISIECEFSGNSGTGISAVKATVFELALTNQPIDVRNLFIGYAPQQTRTMRCKPIWFMYR